MKGTSPQHTSQAGSCPSGARSVSKNVTGTAKPAWRVFYGVAVRSETASPVLVLRERCKLTGNLPYSLFRMDVVVSEDFRLNQTIPVIIRLCPC